MEFKLEHTEAAMKLADTTSAATSMFMDSAEKIHTKVFFSFFVIVRGALNSYLFIDFPEKSCTPQFLEYRFLESTPWIFNRIYHASPRNFRKFPYFFLA